jgi:prepilin-type N-terminal cleavage/methylation domain-containing protein
MCPRYPSTARHVRRGFTLIEASLATTIVGVGVLAMMQLFAACTSQNQESNHTTTAMLLATNIQETMAGLTLVDPAYGVTYFGPEPGQTLASYDDVDDFNGQTFNPPIDSSRKPIAELSQYSQVVSVWPVYANKLSSNTNPSSPDFPQTTYTGAARVLVRIMYQKTPSAVANEVYRTSWVRVGG